MATGKPIKEVIWPTWLSANLEYDEGLSPHWQSFDVTGSHIVSGAEIVAANNQNGKLDIQLKGPAKGITYTLVLTDQSFTHATVNGVELTSYDDLTNPDQGFRAGKSFKGYVVKIDHQQANVELTLSN